jgi:hypothetical protein
MIRGLRLKSSFGASLVADRVDDGRIVRDDGIVTDEENDAINEEENKRRGVRNAQAGYSHEEAS